MRSTATCRTTASSRCNSPAISCPEATLEDRIATAFNRLTPANDEGGTDDEEYRTVAVMDRAATAWTALNGFTMNCVQCHSHPYDPVRHEDYYRFLAFFNTTRDADLPNDAPSLPVPKHPADYAAADAAWRELQAARDPVGRGQPAAGWRRKRRSGLRRRWSPPAAMRSRRSSGRSSSPRAIREVVAELKATLAKVKAEPDCGRAEVPTAGRRGDHGGHGPQRHRIRVRHRAEIGVLTALRVDFMPLDPDEARSTPEDGFIVNRIAVSRIGARRPTDADRHRRLSTGFAEEPGLPSAGPDQAGSARGRPRDRAAVSRADRGRRRADGACWPVDGVDANSKITATRWTVAVPAAPVTAGRRRPAACAHRTTHAAGAQSHGAPRARRGERRCELVAGAGERSRCAAAEVVTSYNRLTRIDNVPLPVMEEQLPPSAARRACSSAATC